MKPSRTIAVRLLVAAVAFETAVYTSMLITGWGCLIFFTNPLLVYGLLWLALRTVVSRTEYVLPPVDRAIATATIYAGAAVGVVSAGYWLTQRALPEPVLGFDIPMFAQKAAVAVAVGIPAVRAVNRIAERGLNTLIERR